MKTRRIILNPTGVSATGAMITQVTLPCEPWNAPGVNVATPRPETDPRRGVVTPRRRGSAGGGDDVLDEE